MKRILYINLLIISVITFYSCIDYIGKWHDNIHLSAKEVEFNAAGDSVIIRTGGSSWWLTDVSVDTTCYYSFPGVDLLSANYIIKKDCFVIERRDKQTLFIKAEANPANVKRIITVGFEAGDYFDRVTITQKSN
jgi:hypothetical protein